MNPNSINNPWEENQQNLASAPGITSGPATPKKSVSDINPLRFLNVWPWMLASMAIAVVGVWLYLRYAVPVYQASASVSLKEEKELAISTSFFDTRNPTTEKTDLLQSPAVVKWVVDTLNLQCNAIQLGKLRNKDLYGKLSWNILNRDSINISAFSFTIEPGKNDAFFNWQKGQLKGVARLGEAFMIDKMVLMVDGKMDFREDAEIICSYQDPWDVAFSISNGLAVTTNKNSSTVSVVYSDILPERARQIIIWLVEAYNNTTVEYKNKSLLQSIRFIQSRLVPLGSELDSIETAQAQFKSSRGFIGSTANGQLYLEKTQILDQQANTLSLQKEILDGVDRYINNPGTPEQNLSVVGLNDGYIQGLVAQFMQLHNEREKLAMVATAENPNRQLIERQLQQVKDNIRVQIKNSRNIINLQQQNLSSQIGTAQGMLRSTPREEKQILEQQRQQNIKQSLFLMLLQRREEASIALASTIVDIRLLAPARTGSPISPKPGQLYALAFGIGLFLPLGLAMLKELFNNKITSKRQLEQMVSPPIIGTIDQTEHEGEQLAIVGRNDRSAAAEQVRAIRANLRYYTPKDRPLTVMVTSTISGEGKTFLSGNLAKSFALQGIRVALVEFDMRRPRLARNMGFEPKIGIPTVLLSECSIEDIILKDTETPNLHLFPTGATPPNPSELLLLPAINKLKKYLDENYDVIILDTPPKGLVADAQLISHWADICLVVVRFNFTQRHDVQEIENWYQQGQLGKMGIIFNGIRTTGYYGSNYYGYNRSYGYGYYAEKKEKGSKSRK